MTQFEYITVSVSMVLALALARMLQALPHVLARDRRYWPHSLWCLSSLLTPFTFWWAIWSFHDVDAWKFREFMSVLVTPAFMYMFVIVLTSNDPDSVASWRTHFFGQRRLFMSLIVAAMLSVLLRQYLLVGTVAAPVFLEGREWSLVVLPGAPLVLGGAGIATGNERFHQVLAVLAAATAVLGIGRLLLAS